MVTTTQIECSFFLIFQDDDDDDIFFGLSHSSRRAKINLDEKREEKEEKKERWEIKKFLEKEFKAWVKNETIDRASTRRWREDPWKGRKKKKEKKTHVNQPLSSHVRSNQWWTTNIDMHDIQTPNIGELIHGGIVDVSISKKQRA